MAPHGECTRPTAMGGECGAARCILLERRAGSVCIRPNCSCDILGECAAQRNVAPVVDDYNWKPGRDIA